MSAPMKLRAFDARQLLFLCHRYFGRETKLKQSLNGCSYSTVSYSDKLLDPPSSSKPEQSKKDIIEFNEADDFFGIVDNTSSPQISILTDDEKHGVSETSVSFGRNGSSEKLEAALFPGQEKVLEVPFGYIRKDSDNPSKLASADQRRRETSKYLNLNEQISFESPEYLSQLFSGQARKEKGDEVTSSKPKNVFREMENQKKYLNAQNTEKYEYKDISSSENNIHKSEDSHKISPNKSEPLSEKLHLESDENFIDEQYFDRSILNVKKNLHQNSESAVEEDNINHKDVKIQSSHIESDLPFIDKHYFGELSSSVTAFNNEVISEKEHISIKDMADTSKSSNELFADEDIETINDVNIFDDQYFREISKDESNKAEAGLIKSNDQRASADSQSKSMLLDSENRETENVIVEKQTRQSKRLREKVKPNIENPETAYDMAMKHRLEIHGKLQKNKSEKPDEGNKTLGRVDSKGFRILKDQVPDWTFTSQEVLAKILKDSIIYDNGDIIAIDKPYGLPSHGGPGVAASIGQVTPILAQLLGKTSKLEKLHLIHRLDKETTGVMILAKTPQMAWRLRGMFQRREVVKKYWMITKGIPNPTEGIIDIPMRETSGQVIHKMCLHPENTELPADLQRKSNLKLHQAITHYKVLDSGVQCALVECQPETGVKHQLRVHMAHALNTPILGDHKYSHYNKLAPQKLYSEILERLGIRQSKVRHLAMHLHAKMLILPEFLDGKNLILSTRLPRHFVTNMKRLKLKPPS